MKLMVGLSGGVDSAVAALLLKQQGYELDGIFMKNWEDDDTDTYCHSREDLIDAAAVADRLGISIAVANFAAEYRRSVFKHFLDEFQAGRTPNPDVFCNREVKFKAFLDHAIAEGASHIATGHYAQIAHRNDQYLLVRGSDPTKDQSYFLYMLGQHELAHSRFPVGGLTKVTVRKLAAEAGLTIHDKADSTGICFIGERQFRPFLSRYLQAQDGDIRTVDGKRIGTHPGVIYFTLGQREGLGIGGIKGAKEAPWYVVDKDLANNILVVDQAREHPLLMSFGLETINAHWVAGAPPALPLRCTSKTRYRQADQTCIVTSIADDRYHVQFDYAQWAVTPGQSIVFYQEEVCLGGAIIDTVNRTEC